MYRLVTLAPPLGFVAIAAAALLAAAPSGWGWFFAFVPLAVLAALARIITT